MPSHTRWHSSLRVFYIMLPSTGAIPLMWLFGCTAAQCKIPTYICIVCFGCFFGPKTHPVGAINYTGNTKLFKSAWMLLSWWWGYSLSISSNWIQILSPKRNISSYHINIIQFLIWSNSLWLRVSFFCLYDLLEQGGYPWDITLFGWNIKHMMEMSVKTLFYCPLNSIISNFWDP